MAKTKQQKQDTVQSLVGGIKQAKAVVFANFQGLKVSDSEDLRRKCRAEKITFLASKKSLLKKALTEIGLDVDAEAFPGGVATVMGTEDDVSPARLIYNFAKTHEVVKTFGGILEGKFIDAAKVKELAVLPSKQELLAKLVGTLNAPISGFVNVLAGNIRNLVSVLNNIKEAKI